MLNDKCWMESAGKKDLYNIYFKIQQLNFII